MPLNPDFTPDQLSDTLEEISPKFAYKMLILEIRLSQQGQNNGNRSTDIAELTSLYMKAVESLQGRFEQGFLFFHNKIQNLMKKRSVVQQLFKSVNSSLSQSQKTLMVISKAQTQQRREEYSVRMTFQNQKFDHKKVKEMIKMTEMKINMIESQIKTGIMSQEEVLEKRIQMRKMRSEASINNDEKGKKRIATDNIEDIFGPQTQGKKEEQKRPRKRSGQKQRKRKLLLFNSFSNEIKI